MKPVHYQPHVLLRQRQREITAQQIEETIGKPEISLPCVDKKRKRVMKHFLGKTLDVIYEDRPKYFLVVTAAWLVKEKEK